MLGGSVTSSAKASAARRNGRAGGRPTLAETLYRVGTAPRVNTAEAGVRELLRKGLVAKDWSRNDASGEAVKLTAAGKERFRAENA